MIIFLHAKERKNYNSKREDNKGEDQPEDERNVILAKDKKNKIIILWEVNSFPTIEIKSGKDHEEDV